MRPSAYSTWLFLNAVAAFANTVVFTVAAVYFVNDVGANPFQLVFIGTVMEITVFCFEVPTGAFADNHGRRLSVVVAFVIQGAGLVLAGLVPAYGIVLLGYVVWGIGATFESGALEAWITDELEGRDLERVFLRGQRAGFAGSLFGLGVSVALASIDLALPFLVAGSLNIILGGTLALVMREDRFTPLRISAHRSRGRDEQPPQPSGPLPRSAGDAGTEATSPKEISTPGPQRLWATIVAGGRLVRTSRFLMVVLGITALHGMHSESMDRLWEAHFLVNFRFPSLGELEPVVWFGVIGAIQLLIGVVVTGAVASRSKHDRWGDAAGTLMALVSVQLLGAIAFALVGSFPLALIAYLVTGLARAVGGPIFYAWINAEIVSSKRATVLSIINQSDAVGQWVGGPVIGAVGATVSLRAALTLGALVLFPVIPLFARARHHDNAKRDFIDIEGEIT